MADIARLDNAIGWVHFRLGGGWKNIISTTVGGLVLVIGLIAASLRIDPTSPTGILSGWTHALLGVQAGVLILLGCSAVRRAVRKDITTGMIESHRLMPVSGTTAIGGYVLGPTRQAMVLSVAALLVGSVTAMSSGIALENWLLANAVLASFAVCTWIVAAFVALKTRGGTGIFVLLVVFAVLGQGIILALLPGLTLPISPIVGASILSFLSPGAAWGPAYQTSFFAHVGLAILCYVGATRRYRRDDLLSFGPLGGLALAAAWAALSVAAIDNWEAVRPRWMDTSRLDSSTQLVSSLLMAMLVAIVPIHAATWIEVQWHRRQRLDDPHLGRRPIRSIPVVLAAAAICLLLPAVVAPTRALTSDSLARTAVVLVAFLFSVSYLLRISYRGKARATVILGIWIFLTWLGPWLIELVRFGMLGLDEDELLTSPIVGCSPVGTLTHIWVNGDLSTNLGLAVQLLLAAAPAILFYALPRRFHGERGSGVRPSAPAASP